ncbi:MAG: pyrroloquinoline-quinone synthase PqqC [Deltaproteobacteria bacterium]
MDTDDLAPERRAFVERLMDVGARKYHDRHRFHQLMNAGKLSREAMQLWALNRFYYQRTIPLKDAAILSNMPDAAMRRRWIQRIVDHDGRAEGEGGLEAWLRLVEAVGARREDALSDRHLLPGVRFAVDAYLTFARSRTWQEAVASSLTELFAPKLHAVRIGAFPGVYPWIDPEGLTYFRTRIAQANADVAHGLSIVLAHFVTPAEQDRAVEILAFKCDILWAQLDAIALAAGV